MKKIVIIFICVSVLWIAPDNFYAEEKRVVELVTLEWPPYVSSKLDNNGFLGEIAKTAVKRAGYQVNLSFKPWKRGLIRTLRGEFDAIFPAYYNDERAKNYILSIPFWEGPLVFIKRKDNKIKYNHWHDLIGLRVGVVLGYANDFEFDAAVKSGRLKVSVQTSDLMNLKMVNSGLLDVAVIDKYTAIGLMNEHKSHIRMKNAKDNLEFLDPPLAQKKFYFMFSRKSRNVEQIVPKFNTALKEMEEDNTIINIIKKHGFE